MKELQHEINELKGKAAILISRIYELNSKGSNIEDDYDSTIELLRVQFAIQSLENVKQAIKYNDAFRL